MSYWLGIDVGTTLTTAAICRQEAGRPALSEVVALGSRCAAVSSVVYLGQDGKVVVGEAAERHALTHPERVVREFTRRIGDQVPIVIGGSPHSAPEITAMVVRWVIERVAAREGGSATGIVLTHPAGWGTYKIQTMAQVLRGSDLPEITFRTEPEAAAVGYALTEPIDPGATVAVYDLGGGTFNATVVRKTGPRTFSVLGAPQAIERLGGADFDDAVFDHVIAAVPALSELDPDDPATLAATAALRRECTLAKEALSADTEITIPVRAPEVRSQVRLIRAELEDMIRPQITETLEALRRALRSADLTPRDLDAVLLVGGSCRVPLVAQLVSAELDRPVAIDTDPKTTIALGAALTALPADTPDSYTAGADMPPDAPVPAVVGSTAAAGSDLPEPAQVEIPPRPSLTPIPLDVEPAEHQRRRARTRRATQIALAGVLALFTAAGVASVPFLSSASGPIPLAGAGTPEPGALPTPGAASSAANAPATNAPTTNVPAADAGNSEEGSERANGAARTTFPAAPNKPVGDATKPGSTAVPTRTSQPAWVTTYTWTTSWSKTPTRSPSPEPTTTTTTTTPPTTEEVAPPTATTTAPPPTTSSSPTTSSPGNPGPRTNQARSQAGG